MLAMIRVSTGSGLVPPTGKDALVFDDPEQLDLQRQRHLADLVEEQRALARRDEEPLVRLHRRRERAADVAEELALEQRLGNRAAVDRHEGRVVSRAFGVHRARDQLLAGSALAGDQHVARRARGQGDLLVERADRVALADERARRPAAGARAGRAGPSRSSPDTGAASVRAPSGDRRRTASRDSRRRPRRSAAIAVSSAAYAVITMTAARGLRTRERSSTSSPSRPGMTMSVTMTSKSSLFDAGQRFLAAAGGRHAVSLGGQGPGQDVLDRGLVVNHEDRRGHTGTTFDLG